MLELTALQLDSRQPSNLSVCRFESGTLNVVLGRNRSGKTALCRLLAGLTSSAVGRVLLDDRDLSELSPAARPVALVNQAFVNYPHWTVRQNLASPLRAQRRPRAEIESTVAAVAEKLQLQALLDRLPEQLSGGQQQRLAIGRALAKGARVVVMDEPLVNLDYKLREALELELAELLTEEGVTLIYTSTDPKDALLLADQVLLLEDHQVLQIGSAETVYLNPVSEAAAHLLSDPGVNRVNDVGLLVRPEHLYLQAPDVEFESYSLDVEAVETNGSQTYLHGRYEQREWIAKLSGMHRFESGTSVRLHARRQDLLQLQP
ncbi:MAG: ABC transporter ATP-binding protein [Pseudomonadales bacterium]